MKKYLFVFIITFLLSACTQNILESSPSKTIPNPKCEDFYSFQVFQVLDNFALAHACAKDTIGYCFGYTVYVPKEKGMLYYDNQKITAKNGQCAFYFDTYSYENSSGVKVTVPKVEFIDNTIPNPAYESWIAEKNKK